MNPGSSLPIEIKNLALYHLRRGVLTRCEVAESLEISRTTLWKWAKQSGIPAGKPGFRKGSK